jgi:hypothetical protein
MIPLKAKTKRSPFFDFNIVPIDAPVALDHKMAHLEELVLYCFKLCFQLENPGELGRIPERKRT